MTPQNGAAESGSSKKRPPSPSPSSTNPKRPRVWRRRPVTCPEPNSLYDILRENCGTSLFVLPILWNDMHTRLLDVEFSEQPPILTPTPSTATTAATTTTSTTSTPTRSSASAAPRPSATANLLSADLTTLLSPEDTRPYCKSRAIKDVLATLYPEALSQAKSGCQLDLYFGNRVFRRAVRAPVLWKSRDAADVSFDSALTRAMSSFTTRTRDDHGGSSGSGGGGGGSSGGSSAVTSCQSSQGSLSTNGPVLVYINRAQLSLIRQNLFRIVPGPITGDHRNMPVRRLQQLRAKQLLPRDPDRDPHLVGLFLAMAQAHFYDKARLSSQSQQSQSQQSQQLQSSSGANRNRTGDNPVVPDFHDLKLRILTHDDDSNELIVYTATVTAAFLRRFAEPAKAARAVPGPESGMRIDYARVPVWPVLGLKERLGKALGPDIVGDLSMDDRSDGTGVGGGGDDDGGVDDDHYGMETWESQDDRTSRLRSLKRKRPLTGMMSAFEQPGGSGGSSSSGSSIGSSNSVTTSTPPIPVSSPTLSPRGKRRRTLTSSLAVC